MTVAAKRPVPVPTADSLPFWQAARKGELRLPRCCKCDKLHYPPPPRCPSCLDSKLRWERLSGRARLVSWTTVHLNTVPGVTPPFTIAEAELIEQKHLIFIALIESCEPLASGMQLEMSFQDMGDIAFPEFKIAPAPENPKVTQAGISGEETCREC